MTHASINGERAIRVRLHVPPIGPWWADVDLDATAPTLSGRVTLALGALELSGTIDASHDGTHTGGRSLRVVAGGGGWATLLPAKAYHNDAQIRALTVAADAAREAGEAIASFEPAAERIGIDYVRRAGPASRALEDAIGGAPWWVDYDGVTQVGERASADASPDDYEVLEHEPAEHVVTLAVDDLTTIGIGSVLSERLDAPQTVREMEVEYSAESFRVRAWTGGEDGGHGRIDRALRSIVARYTDARIYGPRKYRVIRMASDGRVELQVVRRSAGLPDILPITMWPGVAGAYAELALGAEVLVEFIDGLPTEPIITHFAGRDGVGWLPSRIYLAVANPGASGGQIRLGSIDGNHKNLALAELVSERIDKIQLVLDGMAAATVSPDDAGATALQTALKLVWGPGTPATPASDVRTLCVLADRGGLGGVGS